MKKLIFLLFVLLFHNVHAGSFYSGQEVYDKCKSESPYDAGFCVAFIAATWDAHMYETDAEFTSQIYEDPNTKYKKCNSFDGSLGQVKDVLTNFLEINPKKRNLTASSLLRLGIDEWLDCGNFAFWKQFYLDDGYNF